MGSRFPSAVGVKRGMVVLTVLLVLAGSLCLFDRDDDGLSGDMDMCAALTAASFVVAVAVAPVQSDWPIAAVVLALRTATPHLPDPPPKPLLVI